MALLNVEEGIIIGTKSVSLISQGHTLLFGLPFYVHLSFNYGKEKHLEPQRSYIQQATRNMSLSHVSIQML